MTKCTLKECQNVATHVPKVYIPATGWPAVKDKSVSLICGLTFCRRHAEAFEPESIPDLRKLADIAVRMNGSVIPPDLVRAWVVALAIDSDEYRSFKAMGKPN